MALDEGKGKDDVRPQARSVYKHSHSLTPCSKGFGFSPLLLKHGMCACTAHEGIGKCPFPNQQLHCVTRGSRSSNV